ncbi:uncharacterized protein LOC133182836 [Saccostrea echinata]|uniref:uncharacterized protein LOC133182836 n=1 Tax=Saccostrea echinata TaxID=191078 RepID=UPI002A805EBA|nr:uncharacterized protein LOC133182836 [Saccostrea echinata]
MAYHQFNGEIPSTSHNPGLLKTSRMVDGSDGSNQILSRMEERIALIPDLYARVNEMQGVLNQLLHNVQRISESLSINPPVAHVTPTVQRPFTRLSKRQEEPDDVSQSWRSLENQDQRLNQEEVRIEEPDPPSEPSQYAPVISAVTPESETKENFSFSRVTKLTQSDVEEDLSDSEKKNEKEGEHSNQSGNLATAEGPPEVTNHVLPVPRPVSPKGFPSEPEVQPANEVPEKTEDQKLEEVTKTEAVDIQDRFSKLKCKQTVRSNDNRIAFLYSDGANGIEGEERSGSFRQERTLQERSEMRVEMENCLDDTDDEPSANVTSAPLSSASASGFQTSPQQGFGKQNFQNSNFQSIPNDSLRSSLKPTSSLASALKEPDDRPDGGPDLKILTESELEELTLKEANRAADCTDHKSQGADTILCIDTSGSMAGQKFQQITEFIESFLEGIEDVAVENSLEENIAVVTFGNETRVIQNLTNDYSKIRDAVESLETGGPSPIMTGLVLCMSAIYNRGGVVTFRERKIYPRIILLTDGGVTDQRIFNGPDTLVKQGGTKKEVWHKLMEFAERFRTHTDPRHLACVPIGDDADMTLLGQLVNTAGGTIVQPGDVKKLSHHFLINTVVAKVIHDGALRDPKLSDEEMKQKIKEAEGGTGFDESEVDEALRMIRESEQKAQVGATGGFDSSSIETKEMPPIGSRVRRGPDWRWENQDDNLPGTVVAHKSRGYLTVEWDNGNRGKYRYGAESGAKDVRMVDEPRMLPPGMMVAVGVRARRGKDWEWGSQDGGEGSSGVIFKVEDSGIVHVRWDNGKRGNYRFGLFGKYDVEVCPQCIVTEGATGISGDLTLEEATEKKGQWQWRDKDGRWRDHFGDTSDKIEHIYQTRQGKGTVVVECENEKYRVIPDKKCQRNVSTGAEYQIRRIEVTI